MKKELEKKLFKIVKENLLANESETIVKIITEYEDLKERNETLKKEIAHHEIEVATYEKSIDQIEDERNLAEKHASELEEKLKKVNDLKLIEEKLNVRAEMMDKSYKDYFNILKIIFKTPNKISEFMTPIVRTNYVGETDNNGNYVSRADGDYVENQPNKETKGVDYEQKEE